MTDATTATDTHVKVFAPATVANLGPGYDVLGLAVDGPGDFVVARRLDAGRGVQLARITGANLVPSDDNTASIAARHVLETIGVDWGVELELEKGLPIGSGLGSSGASAAAAATAVNVLAGSPLSQEELIPACAEAERAACGSAHRDNVAPALLGGIVLVRPDGGVTRIETDLQLFVALVCPEQELPTRLARETIPASIPLAEVVHNSANLATMIYALAKNDAALLREGIRDRIAEPRRAPLIEGFSAVKAAALSVGALGASISGAGPTIFALCANRGDADRALEAMSASAPGAHRKWLAPVAEQGARRVEHDAENTSTKADAK